MLSIEKLNVKKAQLLSKMEEITESVEDVLTEEQEAQFDSLKSEFDSVVKSIDKAEQLEKARQDNDAQAKRPAPARERIVPLNLEERTPSSDSKIKLPAEVRKNYNLKAFTGEDGSEKAYSFGMYVKACNGDFEASRWCYDHGISVKKFETAHNSTTDSQGGYLVPIIYSDIMASITYNYGVARKECNVIQLGSDTFSRPKDLTSLTAYCVTESAAGTESNGTYGQINLSVKDWVVLTRMTRQLSQDSLISVADNLMDKIGRAFAYTEDYCLFFGDGTSTYGSITGLESRLNTEYGVLDGKAQVVTTSTTLANLRTVISKVPASMRSGSKWFVSPVVFDQTFATLAEAQGGNTTTHIINGVPTTMFMGYPVVLVDIMPASTTDNPIDPSTNAVIAYFGNMKAAVDFGDRQQNMIDFSDSAVIGGESVFERGQIAVRGTERFAMSVHSYGQDDELTPIVGLLAS